MKSETQIYKVHEYMLKLYYFVKILNEISKYNFYKPTISLGLAACGV